MAGCLRLSDVSVICSVVNPRRTSRKIWEGFLYQRNDFESIPTVEMKLEIPYVMLVVNFRRSVIIAELRRPEVTRLIFLTFCVFFETTPFVKIVKILFRSFHRDTDRRVVFNFVKFVRQEIGKIVRCLHDNQNFAWLSSCRYCADRTQNLPGPPQTMYSVCSRFHPNRFNFGGV